MKKGSWKTGLIALAAVCCSSSAAFALENEFHGAYTLTYYLSNYESAGAPGFILTGPNATLNAGAAGLPGGANANLTKNLKTNNYFEQRARLYYSAKANANLKLVTAFEIDSVWGDRAAGSLPQATPAAGANLYTGAFRNSGGALESDAVNLETKWVYLDFKVPSAPTKVKLGIQSYKDNLKGIFADFDIAGIHTLTELDKAKVTLAYFRAYDQSYFATSPTAVRGQSDLDMAVVGASYALSDKSNIGLDYYLYNDPRGVNVLPGGGSTADMQLHTFGLYGDTKLGNTALSGFVAYQGGLFKPGAAGGSTSYQNAYAANVYARTPLGRGTLKSALLVTSGDDQNASTGGSKHFTGWVGTNQSANATWNNATGGTNSYADSDMMLLNRCTTYMPSTTDNHLIFNSGNGTLPTNSQGQYLYTLGYEYQPADALQLRSNIGLGWAAHTNVLKPTDKATGKQNASNFQGGELNLMATYKVFDNLNVRVMAAYLMLGGYYKNAWSSAVSGSGAATDPQDPYSARVVMQYVF